MGAVVYPFDVRAVRGEGQVAVTHPAHIAALRGVLGRGVGGEGVSDKIRYCTVTNYFLCCRQSVGCCTTSVVISPLHYRVFSVTKNRIKLTNKQKQNKTTTTTTTTTTTNKQKKKKKEENNNPNHTTKCIL